MIYFLLNIFFIYKKGVMIIRFIVLFFVVCKYFYVVFIVFSVIWLDVMLICKCEIFFVVNLNEYFFNLLIIFINLYRKIDDICSF